MNVNKIFFLPFGVCFRNNQIGSTSSREKIKVKARMSRNNHASGEGFCLLPRTVRRGRSIIERELHARVNALACQSATGRFQGIASEVAVPAARCSSPIRQELTLQYQTSSWSDLALQDLMVPVAILYHTILISCSQMSQESNVMAP
jgi:hypothetical protein